MYRWLYQVKSRTWTSGPLRTLCLAFGVMLVSVACRAFISVHSACPDGLRRPLLLNQQNTIIGWCWEERPRQEWLAADDSPPATYGRAFEASVQGPLSRLGKIQRVSSPSPSGQFSNRHLTSLPVLELAAQTGAAMSSTRQNMASPTYVRRFSLIPDLLSLKFILSLSFSSTLLYLCLLDGGYFYVNKIYHICYPFKLNKK